jgi:hypothetical protein
MRVYDLIDPAELTGYVRAALADRPANQFQLETFLPSKPVNDLQYRFVAGGQGLAEAATVRAYDAESPIGSRPGVSRTIGELPPISRKIRLGEYDSLRLRNLDSAIRDQVFNDAVVMAKSIAARVELMRGEALWSGQIALNENGVIATVSFGRAGGHTVTAGTPWTTTATADVINDLMTWVATYTTTNGEAPGAAIISSRILGLIMRNAKIATSVGSLAGTPGIVTVDAVNSLVASFGLPRLVVNDEQVKVNGTATRVIPDDKVVFVPASASDLGATLYGVTAEAQEPDYNLAGSPGIVAGAYKTDDPVAVWTKAAAIALPILANPDLTFCADVA